MKNVTLSADENLIEEARAVARSRHTTLNDAFREWLVQYTGRRSRRRQEIEELFRNIRAGSSGKRHFTRDEMNERR